MNFHEFSIKFHKEDFGQPIPIVVLSVNKSDNDEFDLVHYVHGSSRHPDYSSQRRTGWLAGHAYTATFPSLILGLRTAKTLVLLKTDFRSSTAGETSIRGGRAGT